jgi:hypothetical protein
MVAGAGMKLMVLICTESKFSHSGWSWDEADGLDLFLEFLA